MAPSPAKSPAREVQHGPKSTPRYLAWCPSRPQEGRYGAQVCLKSPARLSGARFCIPFCVALQTLGSFFIRRCGTLATWPSSLPRKIQHGVQVGTQEVARSPASPQVGPLRCNMVPTGTQVGPEIPTMVPESANLGHLGAVSGRFWAVLGRSVGKVKMRGSFSGKIARLCVFTVIGARPELRSG